MILRILFLAAALPAFAGIIISESATPGDCCNGSAAYVSWTQTVTYTNVVITANIVGPEKDFDQGTAYLMSQIGPGTTAANEIVAPGAYSSSSPISIQMTLFSGLTLGPGSYFLVLAPVKGLLEWDAGTTPFIESLGTGVTAGSAGYFSSPAVFVPASTPSQTGSFIYSVTGDLGGASTPEPSTAAIVIAGLAIIVCAMMKRHEDHRLDRRHELPVVRALLRIHQR